jgi:hypothetical protein
VLQWETDRTQCHPLPDLCLSPRATESQTVVAKQIARILSQAPAYWHQETCILKFALHVLPRGQLKTSRMGAQCVHERCSNDIQFSHKTISHSTLQHIKIEFTQDARSLDEGPLWGSSRKAHAEEAKVRERSRHGNTRRAASRSYSISWHQNRRLGMQHRQKSKREASTSQVQRHGGRVYP